MMSLWGSWQRQLSPRSAVLFKQKHNLTLVSLSQLLLAYTPNHSFTTLIPRGDTLEFSNKP